MKWRRGVFCFLNGVLFGSVAQNGVRTFPELTEFLLVAFVKIKISFLLFYYDHTALCLPNW